MPDKIMDVLDNLVNKQVTGRGGSSAMKTAHSQILEIFKEMLPKERGSLNIEDTQYSFYNDSYWKGFNQALQDIRAKIEEE